MPELVIPDNWVQNSEEDPRGGLMPIGMDVRNWVRSRIDFIDIGTCTQLAQHDQDALVVEFIEDGLVAEVVCSPEGAPLIDVKRMRLWEKEDASG